MDSEILKCGEKMCILEMLKYNEEKMLKMVRTEGIPTYALPKGIWISMCVIHTHNDGLYVAHGRMITLSVVYTEAPPRVKRTLLLIMPWEQALSRIVLGRHGWKLTYAWASKQQPLG